MAPLRTLLSCLLVIALTAASRGEGDKVMPAPDDGAYETDRPGEIENPFALPAGSVEVVTYLVGANGAAREDLLGGEGSAVLLDTALRVGLASRVEALLSVDSFLAESSLTGSRPKAGLGFLSLAAKWNLLKDAEGEYGVGLAPLFRLPLNQAIAGTARPTSGLIIPFDLDLEGGWELQGSTGVARAPEAARDWSAQWENQVSVERTLLKGWVAYLELQIESGSGSAAFSTEFGFNWQIGPRVLADLGASVGLGNDRARMAYAGLGWRY